MASPNETNIKYRKVEDFDFDNPPEGAVRVKVIVPDYMARRDPEMARWEVGEIGYMLQNDYPEKYDYMVYFRPGIVPQDQLDDPDLPSFLKISPYDRTFYFHKEEVEVLTNSGNQ